MINVARMKHDARRDDGDAQGCAVWQLVLAAIAALSQRAPGPGDALR